eukprot:3398934-Prymnesium_polylepis.1
MFAKFAVIFAKYVHRNLPMRETKNVSAPRAPRGALERWFGGPTRSRTSPEVSLVHGRLCPGRDLIPGCA